MEAVYLVLGLCVIGALAYVLMQVTARQNRLNAEMTRLERLAAEVTMNAEVVLEQVDVRIERLEKIVAETETKVVTARAEAPVAAAAATPAPIPAAPAAEQPAPVAAQTPAPEPAPTPVVAAAPAPAVEAEPPTAPRGNLASMERYQQVRTSVWALADQGRTVVEIAQALGLPRGEVQLIINLRGKKVTA